MILVIKWQTTWLNCVLTEEISKQSVGKVPWSFLTANRKRCKERNELKKESLSKKEPELEVW